MHHIIVIILTLRTKVYNMAENYNAKEFIFCVSVHTGRMNTSLPTRILCVCVYQDFLRLLQSIYTEIMDILLPHVCSVCVSLFVLLVLQNIHTDYMDTSCILFARLLSLFSRFADYFAENTDT